MSKHSGTTGQIIVPPIHGEIQFLRMSKHSKWTRVNYMPPISLAEAEPKSKNKSFWLKYLNQTHLQWQRTPTRWSEKIQASVSNSYFFHSSILCLSWFWEVFAIYFPKITSVTVWFLIKWTAGRKQTQPFKVLSLLWVCYICYIEVALYKVHAAQPGRPGLGV